MSAQPPVRRARYGLPRWMHRALRRRPSALAGYNRAGSSWWIAGPIPRWIDHWGVDPDDPDVFVAEPYGLDGDDLASLAAFAADVGAIVSVSAQSAHLPGETLRVEMREDPS